ncbi:MAG TPA: acyl-CoA dehydrogenase family protein [Acidimicrobiales bacterium]|nr:acyl-CoA dehydrogenase family protein [Acidimicrobiales bacterium]
MDFELNSDQIALADGIRRLCDGRFPLERLRIAEGSASAIDDRAWRELADAGVFSLRAVGDEGLGLGMAEAAVVFEELGRALVPGPLVASHVAATLGLVDGAATGKAVVGAARRPSTVKLDAVVPVLLDHFGALTELVVVDDEGLWSVDPSTVDAQRIERSLDPLTPMWKADRLPIGTRISGTTTEDAVIWRRDTTVLTGALCVGLAFAELDLAVEYAKNRQQFGRPVGSFQAIKHLCADMVVRAETARVAVHAAAVTIDQPDVGDPERAVAGASLLAAEAALANGRACIQVHGGMGFTWDVPAHLYLMRARVLSAGIDVGGGLAEIVAERY